MIGTSVCLVKDLQNEWIAGHARNDEEQPFFSVGF